MTIMDCSKKETFLSCPQKISELTKSLPKLLSEKKFKEFIHVYCDLLHYQDFDKSLSDRCLESDLQQLISTFCSVENQIAGKQSYLSSKSTCDNIEVDMRLLLCVSCAGVMLSPVTLSCGHTVCHVCVSKDSKITNCMKCLRHCEISDKLQVNVLICHLANKWWPDKIEAAKHRLRGNSEYRHGNYTEALASYTEATKLDPSDPISLSNRSQVHVKLKNYTEAVDDCSKAVQLAPDVPKSHYKKANVYLRMGDAYNAALMYLVGLCHKYDKEVEAELAKLITNLVIKGDVKGCTRVINLFDECRKFWRTQAVCLDPNALLKPPSTVDPSDLECNLCYQVLWKPVTTVCGHTFCSSCLERWLDHKPNCPLCKNDLSCHPRKDWFAVTDWIWMVIKMFLTKEYSERKIMKDKEMEEFVGNASEQGRKIPIFVCTVAFPCVPCQLHVFEPRYRLMIRRCMESGTRVFGMCHYSENGEFGYSDYGVLLSIGNITYFPDGRCLLQTVGTRRFKVVSRSTKDGYNVAVVDLLRDEPVAERSRLKVMNLLTKTYELTAQWFEKQSLSVKNRINRHFGPLPSFSDDHTEPDGPSWLWWLSAVLPIDEKSQVTLLSHVMLEARIPVLLKVLIYLNEHEAQ